MYKNIYFVWHETSFVQPSKLGSSTYCDYNDNNDEIAMDVVMKLVVAALVVAVTIMIVTIFVVDHQEG